MPDVQEALQAVSSAEATTTEAPSETTETTETPTEAPAEATTTEAVPEAKPEPTLYKLPDGREVDGETLAKEWKENFLPDYTRKSQEHAKLTNTEAPQAPTEQGPKWKDPNWEPQSYAEILDAATERVRSDLEAERLAEMAKKEEVNSWVQTQLDEIKKSEPSLSEELLFQHANKYGFGDLKTAYQNMKDFNLAVKHTEQKVLKNLKTREAEPIAAKPNAGEVSDGVDYYGDRAESALEALQRVQGR
jgi:hypothetical protein